MNLRLAGDDRLIVDAARGQRAGGSGVVEGDEQCARQRGCRQDGRALPLATTEECSQEVAAAEQKKRGEGELEVFAGRNPACQHDGDAQQRVQLQMVLDVQRRVHAFPVDGQWFFQHTKIMLFL